MVNQAKVGKVHATTIRNHTKPVCFIVLTNSYSHVVTKCSVFLIHDCLSENPPSLHLPVFQEISF